MILIQYTLFLYVKKNIVFETIVFIELKFFKFYSKYFNASSIEKGFFVHKKICIILVLLKNFLLHEN